MSILVSSWVDIEHGRINHNLSFINRQENASSAIKMDLVLPLFLDDVLTARKEMLIERTTKIAKTVTFIGEIIPKFKTV